MLNQQYAPITQDTTTITSNELLSADVIYVPCDERIAEMTQAHSRKICIYL